ncbi:hypothetical protein ACW7G2_11080 [Luteimonas sp. A277]
MMPWYAWAYLVMLALIGLAGFRARLRAGKRPPAALGWLAAMAVVMLGVVLFYRGAGAGLLFMGALLLSVLVLAQHSVAQAQRMREAPIPAGERLVTSLGGLATLPAIAMGAIAVWVRQLV